MKREIDLHREKIGERKKTKSNILLHVNLYVQQVEVIVVEQREKSLSIKKRRWRRSVKGASVSTDDSVSETILLRERYSKFHKTLKTVTKVYQKTKKWRTHCKNERSDVVSERKRDRNRL